MKKSVEVYLFGAGVASYLVAAAGYIEAHKLIAKHYRISYKCWREYTSITGNVRQNEIARAAPGVVFVAKDLHRSVFKRAE